MNSAEISVFNGHSGDRFAVNRYYFVSIDELKAFSSKQFGIPVQQLFIISPFGIKLKNSSMEEVDEVYVFNRDLFTSSVLDDSYVRRFLRDEHDSLETLIQPINSPLLDLNWDNLNKSRNSRQLISLLTTNLGWVSAIESDSRLFAKKVQDLEEKIQVLFTSLKVASQYINGYCSDVKRTFDSSIDFIIDLQKHSLNLTWKDHLEKLVKLKMLNESPLSSLLDKEELSRASHESIKINEVVNNQFMNLKPKIVSSKKERLDIEKDLDFLSSETNKVLNDIQAGALMSELQLLSDKVRKDTHRLLQSPNPDDDLGLDLILETFQNHKTEYVNSIYQISTQLYQNLITVKDIYNRLQLKFTKFLHRLAISQSVMVTLNESLKSITPQVEEIQTLEAILANTVDLPLLYGLYLIEVLRREQWLSSVKQFSAKTNEKFANLREKEIKVRNQWIRNYGIILRLLDHDSNSFNNNSIINFELAINEDEKSKQIEKFTFDDCSNYIQQLEENGIPHEVTETLIKAFEDMSMKKVTLNIGSSSKTADNDTIKGYKQRIKKLENLLHQEQFKNFSQWPAAQSSGPRLSALSKFSLVLDSKATKSSIQPNSGLLSPDAISRSPSPQQSEEISKLTRENADLSEALKRNNNETETLKDEIKWLKQMLSGKELENKGFVKQLENVKEELQKENSKLQFQITEEQMNKVQLNVETETKSQIINELETKLKEKEELIDELKSEHANTLDEFKQRELQNFPKEQIAMLRSQIERLVAEKAELEKNLRNKVDELSNLYDTTNEKDSVIEDHQLTLKEKDATIAKLEAVIKTKGDALEEYVGDLKAKNELIEQQEKTIRDNDLANQTFESRKNESLKELQSKIDELTSQNEQYSKNLETWKEDFERLKCMKNDLLENMSNREDEFSKEKSVHQQETEELREKIVDLETTHQEDEKALELKENTIKQQSSIIFKLIIIINSLIIKSKDLCDILLTFYQIFISSLKSIGLLAVKTESKVDIIRVKGLRKNTGENLMATVDLTDGVKPIFDEDVLSNTIWSTVPDESLLSELNDSQGGLKLDLLVHVAEKIIENYNLTTYEDKFLRFVDQITNMNTIYVVSVAKRFKEVESLAKKELKENKRLRENNSGKITIKDFKTGDLVLFLPTSKQDGESFNHWAAFNDMGDSKYLLKESDTKIPLNRQWFIGKIIQMQKADKDEYLITAEVLTN